jgi:PAS domain S-box-containing protein
MDEAEQFDHTTQRLAQLEAESQHLRLKASLFDKFIKRTPAAVAMFDTQMRYLIYSDRWLTDYHLGKQDLTGRSHYEVFPEIPERWRAIHQRVLSGESMSMKEDPFPRADGTTDWVSWECVPWYRMENSIGGIIMFTEVVTEQVLAREALRRDEERFHRLYDSMMDAFVRVNMQGYVVESNQTFQQLLGYTPTELAHRTYRDLTPPQWRSKDKRIIDEQVMRRGFSEVYEKEYIRKDGTIIPVELRVFLLRQDSGEPEGMWAIVRDITERKQAERALEEERALLYTGIEILPFPIIFASPDGDILRANREATALRMTLAVPRKVQLLEPDTRREVPEEQWPEQRAFRGEVIANAEYLVRSPEGHEIPILLQAAPIYIKDELIGIVMATQNISRLKEADRAKDQFLMVLSHELKTPVTSILGWARTALKIPEESAKALDVIMRNAQEQARILDDLLDVSRIVTGRLLLQPTPHDLWNLVRLCVENVRPSVLAHNLTLHTEAPEEPLPVLVDADRLQQAINNLLTNAIKYTEPGGEVRLRAYRRDDQAVLEVRDTGRGIAPDELPRLFRPFLQLHREEQKGGLGLGLSLVKGIVELHGGLVTAASPGLGQGSTFSIILPLHVRG